jgi:hypothetical protein
VSETFNLRLAAILYILNLACERISLATPDLEVMQILRIFCVTCDLIIFVLPFQITPVIVERATLNLNVGDKRKPPTQKQQYQTSETTQMRNNFDVLIRILVLSLKSITAVANCYCLQNKQNFNCLKFKLVKLVIGLNDVRFLMLLMLPESLSEYTRE